MRRGGWAPLLCLLLVGAALRVAAILTVGDIATTHGDENYYVGAARMLAHGEPYPNSIRPPAFPAFIALFMRLNGNSSGDELFLVRLAQVVVSLLGVALVFDLVRRRFGVRAAFISGLICTLHPTLIHYTHFLWAENQAATLLLLALWLLDRFDRSGTAGWLTAAGLSLGLAILTREMILYFVPLVVVWLWLRPVRTMNQRQRETVLLLAAVFSVIVPWTLRNYQLHQRFVLLSTTRWFPIALGNFPSLDGSFCGRGATSNFTRRYQQIPGEIAREAFAQDTALRGIVAQQPVWLARKLACNGFALLSTKSQLSRFLRASWIEPRWRPLARRLVRIEAAFYTAQMLIGIVALWLVPGGRLKALVVALIVLHLAIYAVANSNHRFRVPLLPLFALYAGPLLLGRVAPGGWRGWRAVGAAICVVAFAAIIYTDVVLYPREIAPESDEHPRNPLPQGKPNLVLVSIDTLRADHLGSYGYPRPTSPQIDALARDGTLFEKAFSPSSWTLPAHASMLTGVSPFQHGAVRQDRRIRDDVPTLAELLRERGYTTIAAVNAPFVSAGYGFSRGFDRFLERLRERRDPDAYQTIVLQAVRSLRREPVFVFLHYMSVHSPYTPPARFDRFRSPGGANSSLDGKGLLKIQRTLARGERQLSAADRDHLIDLYDGEILAMDERLGEVLNELARQLAGPTIVVLTSDHGEEFLDHGGVLHGHTLYDELLHVPLIVSGSGIPRGRYVPTMVSLLDIAPAILEWAGQGEGGERQVRFDGSSLASFLGQADASPSAEPPLALHTAAHDGSLALRGYRSASLKLVRDDSSGRREIYDLRADPLERSSLDVHPEAAQLEQRLELLAVNPSGPPPLPNEEVRKSLRALGYM